MKFGLSFLAGLLAGIAIASACGVAQYAGELSVEAYGTRMYRQGFEDGTAGERMAPDKAWILRQGRDPNYVPPKH